jgi:hypothetical protein
MMNSYYNIGNNDSVLNNSTGSYYDSYYKNNSNYWYPNDTSSSSVETIGSPIFDRGNLFNNQYNHSYSNTNNYHNNYQSINSPINTHINYKSSPIIVETNSTDGVNNDFSTKILPLIDAITNGSSKRRMRTAFTQDQRKYLLQVFEKHVYPGKDLLEELAAKMNVNTTIVQVNIKIDNYFFSLLDFLIFLF